MTKPNNRAEMDHEEEQTFISHLLELRDRLLRIVLSILVVFLSLFYFSNDIYTFVAGPLLKHLPAGSTMVAIDVASPFLTPIKLTLVLSVFISMPYILHQIWQFVAPGLYQHERKMAAPILVSSIILFYLGMAFAYYVVLPLVFTFFTSVAPQGVAVMTDISKYLDFVLTVFFAFGVAFEIPIATIVLVWLGAVTPEKLKGMRPYIIVGCFVIGMLLTPPDIISQTLLAVPMWLLFEFGVYFSQYYVPKRDQDEAEEEEVYDLETDEMVPAHTVAGTGRSASDPPNSDDEYKPLSDEEMDAELDRADEEIGKLSGEESKEEGKDDEREDSSGSGGLDKPDGPDKRD
jgi:sec-independent protein translocase protein TatC